MARSLRGPEQSGFRISALKTTYTSGKRSLRRQVDSLLTTVWPRQGYEFWSWFLYKHRRPESPSIPVLITGVACSFLVAEFHHLVLCPELFISFSAFGELDWWTVARFPWCCWMLQIAWFLNAPVSVLSLRTLGPVGGPTWEPVRTTSGRHVPR